MFYKMWILKISIKTIWEIPDVEGEGQFWMCAPDQRKQPCQLGCEDGFNQVGNDLYVECFCKRSACEARELFF